MDSRLRGNDGVAGLSGMSCCHPLLPCQALGQPLIPLSSRERGIRLVVLDLFTLTFDSSPIKGEGIPSVVLDLLSARPVD